jgi:hypothetical protein
MRTLYGNRDCNFGILPGKGGNPEPGDAVEIFFSISMNLLITTIRRTLFINHQISQCSYRKILRDSLLISMDFSRNSGRIKKFIPPRPLSPCGQALRLAIGRIFWGNPNKNNSIRKFFYEI